MADEVVLRDKLGRPCKLKDPAVRSKGNGWKELTPEERSAKGREMQRARQEKEAARRADAAELELLAESSMSMDEFREKLVRPEAVRSFKRLAVKAREKDDTSLQKWVVEHFIGKASSKQEIDANVGVTINIVRPPRGEVVEGEMVEETA
jgi:hypothetical protein